VGHEGCRWYLSVKGTVLEAAIETVRLDAAKYPAPYRELLLSARAAPATVSIT
jgi:hypothetical protein